MRQVGAPSNLSVVGCRRLSPPARAGKGHRGLVVTVRPLLERRLVIVTGKGGTGKTTVAAALALAAVGAGKRVLMAEVGPEESLAALFDPETAPVGYEGRELQPGLRAMRVDPYEALAEYLSLQIPVRTLVRTTLRNRAFRQLLDASPGWRELITLGKIWHLEQARDRDGRPRFDLLVVDAPATGHGLTFLDVPRVVVSAVQAGPLRRHAGWVEELVRDANRTLLLPVALAEELPARETVELVERARDQVSVAIDRVVVNAVMPSPFPPEVPDLDERLARLGADETIPGAPDPPVLAACAAHLRARHELNRRWVEEIGRAAKLPLTTLPLLLEGMQGPESLAVLGEHLLAEPAAA